MKVRSIVAQGDALVPFLQPFLIPDRDVPIESYVTQLKHALTYSPQFVRVFASLGECFQCGGSGHVDETKIVKKDGKDVEKLIEKICPSCRGSDSQEQIHGFMIAYAPEGMSYIFISQTYVHPKASAEHLAQLYINKIKAWADSQGKRSLRIETSRDPRGLIRKYGFKELSVLMELRLDEQEISNGQEQRSEIGINIDEGSADLEQSVDQLSESGDGSEPADEPPELNRQGSDTLRGSDSPESSAAVSADSESVRTDQPSADTGVVVAG